MSIDNFTRWRWVLGRHGFAPGENYLLWELVELWSLRLSLKWGGEWTCLAETCLEEESSDIRLATDLCARYWSVILGNFLLNRSTTFANAVKSLRQM